MENHFALSARQVIIIHSFLNLPVFSAQLEVLILSTDRQIALHAHQVLIKIIREVRIVVTAISDHFPRSAERRIVSHAQPALTHFSTVRFAASPVQSVLTLLRLIKARATFVQPANTEFHLVNRHV